MLFRSFLLVLVVCCCSLSISAQVKNGQQWYEQAINFYQNKDYAQALSTALIADSMLVLQGNDLEKVQSKMLLAKIYTIKRQPNASIQASEAALAGMVAAGKKDSLMEADALNTYGGRLLDLRRYAEAEDAFMHAIDIKKKILGENTPEIGIQLSNLANLYFKTGEIGKAIEFGKKGIAIRENGISPNPTLLTAYTNLGIFLQDLGLYPQALEYFGKVEKVIEQSPDQYPDRAGALYQSLANLYHDLADFDKSKKYALLAIYHFSALYGPNSQPVAEVYFNLALVAGDEGNQEKQIEYAQSALAAIAQSDEPNPLIIADCYEQISTGYLNNNPDSSLFFAQKSRVLLDSAGVNEGITLASNLSCFALAYGNKNDIEKADSLMQLAVFYTEQAYGPKYFLTANFLTIRANINLAAKRYDRALALYDASLAAYGYPPGAPLDSVLYPDQLLDNLINKNKTRIAMHNLAPSLEKRREIDEGWTEILHLLDYLRLKFQDKSTKLLFTSKFWAAANAGIRWYTDTKQGNNPEKAWEMAEKARSMVLLEAFRQSGAWRSTTDSLRGLSEIYTAEKKKWNDLYENARTSTERAENLQQVLAANQRYEQWLQDLEHSDSVFFTVKYSNKFITHTELCKLLQPEQALIEYFVGDSSLYLFVVRPDTFIIQEVKRDFPLKEWVDGLREGLYGYYAAPKEKRIDTALQQKCLAQYLAFAPKLYQKLIEPVEKWLPEKVILVPDGLLGNIPFEALLSKTPDYLSDFKSYPYLLQKYQFSYTYSATLLQEMRSKKHLNPPEKPFIGVAPFWNGDVGAFETQYGEVLRGEFTPLAYTKDEVGLARKKMGGDVLIGEMATVQKFIQVAAQYQIIHLATHGVADHRLGDYAYLVFSQLPNRNDYSLLYVKDLYALTLNADLVVLSSCETGIGKLQKGEGIISLARAFAFAGTKSMITALWSVSNKSTAELMTFFYEELSANKGKGKDEALRDAKRRFIAEGSVRNSHPFFWAAFVPIGDMRPIR